MRKPPAIAVLAIALPTLGIAEEAAESRIQRHVELILAGAYEQAISLIEPKDLPFAKDVTPGRVDPQKVPLYRDLKQSAEAIRKRHRDANEDAPLAPRDRPLAARRLQDSLERIERRKKVESRNLELKELGSEESWIDMTELILIDRLRNEISAEIARLKPPKARPAP